MQLNMIMLMMTIIIFIRVAHDSEQFKNKTLH